MTHTTVYYSFSGKLRLEDIDTASAKGFPKLTDSVGNMEEKEWNIPPGPGEGGVEKLVLDDSLKDKVKQTINEYGFNQVASGNPNPFIKQKIK